MQKVSSSVAGGGNRLVHAPLMRPLTPSSVGPSLHHIEHQLLEAEVQLENYTSGLMANFELMRSLSQPVAQPQALSSLHKSSCSPPELTPKVTDEREGGGQRRDLREKSSCNGYLKDVGDDQVVADRGERRNDCEERRPVSSHGSRPSTRGSRYVHREDIKKAIIMKFIFLHKKDNTVMEDILSLSVAQEFKKLWHLLVKTSTQPI